MAETLPRPTRALTARHDLIAALRSCSTEADVVQVLFQGMRERFGYEVVSMQVLEREGWYHLVAVDEGILQDVRRRRLDETPWAPFYERGVASVHVPPSAPPGLNRSRGLGAERTPQRVIFVPFEYQGQITGAVLYQTYAARPVPEDEIDFLLEIHRHLGVVVANAYLNELTRNQAVRLTALNTIARALASTLDEAGVVAALHQSLAPMLPLDTVAITVPEPDGAHARVRRSGGARTRPALRLPYGSRRLQPMRQVLQSGQPRLDLESGGSHPSSLYVPILDRGLARAVLSIHSTARNAYEDSTVTFLEQVADEAALALRNAESYAALEAQRRRHEVVNAVGRRLASSLDRWSIMRTLREELARHLAFDGFALATVTETEEGPVAEGYTYYGGEETDIYTVPLAAAGPSRQAYETGQPVLVRRSRWARSIEAQHPAGESLIRGEGAIVYVGGEHSETERRASRSLVWVPVRHGDRISALLSLQSFKADGFNEWHVQLLQDVAAHVSLALANAEHFAAAQAERRRLEALHVLELGVAGSGDERQVAEAVCLAAKDYIRDANFVLCYLDAEGRLTGYGFNHEAGIFEELEPKPPESTNHFRQVQESGRTLVRSIPVAEQNPARAWRSAVDSRLPVHVAWIPVSQGGRVVAALSAQRMEDTAFTNDEVTLLESAAPVVGIALRTVRLHRANELALAHSVRMQEVAALAGHDVATVVHSIAEQAQSMLGASGSACWAIDSDLRVSADGASGDPTALRVLEWAGAPGGRWTSAPRDPVSGRAGSTEWTLIPLWYADVLVGALGSIHPAGAVDQAGTGVLDFARHAAIAIENARLGAETRDRIRTLEAVAAFTELDVIQPTRTRQEMAELIERALEPGGSLWLLDGEEMVRVGVAGHRVPVADPAALVRELRHDPPSERVRELLLELTASGSGSATPVLVDGRLCGLVVVEGRTGSYIETRRLMSVLAGQAGVVLGRLRLVDALERERRMMEAILRHSPVGVILEDETGRVIYANPEAEQLYGVAADAMTGRELAEILNDAGAEVQSDPEAEPGSPLVLKMSDPDRVVEVRRVPIPGAAAEPAATLSMHEDVTEERQMLEAKDLMLRAIGHEVRSPAAAMRSTLAGILQWENLMEAKQRSALLAEAYEMSDRLLSLVEGQLIIAKLETRRFEPNPARVALTQAVDHVMAVLRHRYGDRVGRVDVQLPVSLPDAFCEPTHLEQVLTNLMGNACEYTTAPIHVTARNLASGWLEVTVADEGQGLPADRVESLFRKTGPAGQNRARGGLGLGLYFCRLVVERSFGGRIWLAATGRGGTTFKFTVPAAENVSLTAVSGG